ncbi:MAG TPA: hypothetical protein VMR34_05460 [Candidatus Saccharimonadales bacterium]|nr:hypothetical protein [Candidatus Saccharimonadales bacterium]
MRRTITGLFVFACLLCAPSQAFAYTDFSSGKTGYDVSWPNCEAKISPLTPFGVVGVSGGLSFHPNLCVGQEASLFKSDLSLYTNTGYPGRPYADKYSQWPKSCSFSNDACLAYNYGFNAAKYSFNYALSHGVVSRDWWLDVETINSWANEPSTNQASIGGEANALSFYAQPTVLGVYAYPGGWQTLTGNWQNKWPAWVASNSNFRSVAQSYCRENSFNGGAVLLTQYIGQLDTDYAC